MNSETETNKYALISDIKTRQAEFLYDTLVFYNCNNRSAVNGTCVYTATDCSPGCAIGRHLAPEIAQLLERNYHSKSVHIVGVFTKLPSWMQDMGEGFLTNIQALHDTCANWTEYGFNKHRAEILKEIIATYGLNLKLDYTDTGVVKAAIV